MQTGGMAMAKVNEKAVHGDRIPMLIAIWPKGKRLLSMLAVEHDIKVSAVINQCVGQLRKEAGK